MASPGPSSPPASRSTRRWTPAAAVSNAGALPPDVLFDVLLRLPAKELCRLRAVCRAWRCLTVDPLFASAHAARHPDPLFLANFRDDQTHICVVDLSGDVLKRIPNAYGHLLLCTRLDLACAVTITNSCRVLDPATGNVHVLPESPAVEHSNRENLRKPFTSFAFGKIATTGEYKVLRIFKRPSYTGVNSLGVNEHQLFEVLTISSASGSGSAHVQWRARQSYDRFVEASSAIVIGEVVYFMVDSVYESAIGAGLNPAIDPGCIILFDLDKEEWRGHLQGPISDMLQTDEHNHDFDDYCGLWCQLTLADLRGSLVLAHYRDRQHIMDLWLLKDFENGLWAKDYSIQTETICPTNEIFVRSLFMLDDGRLVIHFPLTGRLLIYDPRTNSYAQLELRHLDAVAMYTGNLLSL